MLLPALAAPALLAAALALPPAVKALLDDGTLHNTPAGLRVVALSHAADGCAARDGDRDERHACVAQAFARAWAHKPPGIDVDAGRAGLWLTHVALILGAADATGPCLDAALHRRIALALARATARDPLAIAASYANKSERWPADQAATLAALARADHAHGTALLPAALQRYRAQMERAHDDATHLPWSEAHGRGAGKSPRGCALSWSVRYLSEVDVDLAAAWWAAYKDSFLVDRGVLVGFREWPPGSTRGADVDSGPIVHGVGAAATAFGIAAARAMDDDTLALRLEATAAIVAKMAPHLDAHAAAAADSTLAQAILFQAAHQASALP